MASQQYTCHLVPRADLLASLDAAFASKPKPKESKYTASTTVRAAGAASQQAYQHSKRSKNKKRRGQNTTPISVEKKAPTDVKNPGNATSSTKHQEDLLYRKLPTEVLSIGLKNCSLHAQIGKSKKIQRSGAVLNKYLVHAMQPLASGNESGNKKAGVDPPNDMLRAKVVQLDNPPKPTVKQVEGMSQTAKLMSSRHRRKLGLHLMKGEMKVEDAKKLQEIWQRYAWSVLESECCAHRDQPGRSARLEKLMKPMDLSGAPVEIVSASHPCNVGLKGIIMAEHQNVIQICSVSSGKIQTLPRRDVIMRIHVQDSCQLLVDGSWLQMRMQ